MAEKKISQLTAKGATVADTDLLVVSESAGGGAYTTKSITGANVKALVTDANLTTTDITTNDVSTSKHGFAPKAPNDTTKFLRGDGTWAVPASGGLTEFTELETTAAPNATVPVNSLTPVTATTNADVAIVPKGSGAILAAIPNNAGSGGNKRGTNAVDLQTSRSSATQVASGQSAVIAGGDQNTASGPLATVGGGTNNISSNYRTTVSGGIYNTASGIHATVGGGYNNSSSGEASFTVGEANTASGSRSAAIGQSNIANTTYASAIGYNNTASGQGSIALGSRNTASGIGAAAIGGHPTYGGNTASGEASLAAGQASTASGYASFAMGVNNVSDYYGTVATGLGAKTFGLYGRKSHSCGYIGTVGDSQKSTFTLGQRTTNNTPTTLISYYAAGTTPSAVNQVILSNQSAYRFKGTIIGKQSGSTNAAVWDIDGFIVRGANAAATTLNVSNVTLVQNTPAWGTPTLAADTTNGGLQVQVTGAAGTNIQWTAVIDTTEVIYA